MGLLSYIKGNKKGLEAHNLEREAMQDLFLADALDGYSNIEDPELDVRLRRMEKKIEQNRSNRPEKTRRGYLFWMSAAAVMIFVCTISYELGLISGRGHLDFVENNILSADGYEQSVPESAESALAIPNRSFDEKTQAAMAERQLNNKEPLYENADELPCPTNGYKAYYEYVYKEMKELVTFDSNNISGIVVLHFDIDNSGRPSNIEIIESSSEAIARKLIDIVRKGDRWSGYGKVESFVFIY